MSLLAIIKTLYTWIVDSFHMTGYIGLVEFCQRCGVRQPIAWQCDSDEIWKEVNGTKNGVLCPKCFDELASRKGIVIIFHAVVHDVSK